MSAMAAARPLELLTESVDAHHRTLIRRISRMGYVDVRGTMPDVLKGTDLEPESYLNKDSKTW